MSTHRVRIAELSLAFVKSSVKERRVRGCVASASNARNGDGPASMDAASSMPSRAALQPTSRFCAAVVLTTGLCTGMRLDRTESRQSPAGGVRAMGRVSTPSIGGGHRDSIHGQHPRSTARRVGERIQLLL